MAAVLGTLVVAVRKLAVAVQPVIPASAEKLIERMRAYVDIGFRHVVCGFPAPYDAESMERLAKEIRPALEGRRSA